jgi:hypothetical protein
MAVSRFEKAVRDNAVKDAFPLGERAAIEREYIEAKKHLFNLIVL